MELSSLYAGLGTSALNTVGGLITSAVQNKYNREMAALQNQYNIDMWNMQNEYNKPSAQLSRLVDAGLSPNLFYGSLSPGNASNPPQQVAPQQVAPQVDTPNFLEMLRLDQMFQQIEQSSAQTKLLQENARSVELDNLDKEARNKGRARYANSVNPIDHFPEIYEEDGLSRYYAYTTYLTNTASETGIDLNSVRTWLTRTQEATAKIEQEIKYATKDEQIQMIKNLNIIRSCEAGIKQIIYENQDYLQSFNQKAPQLRLILSLISAAAGAANNLF